MVGGAMSHGEKHGGRTIWLRERLTSIASLPLTLWLVWAVVRMPSWDHATFTAWLASPLNAVLMILSVLVIFYHTALGCRVIVEDYIHHEGFRAVKLRGINLFFLAAALACIFSILKIAFTG